MHILRQNEKRILKNIPSILILLTVLAFLLYNFCEGINGNDFWWHIKVGEWIVEERKIPTHDIFSWYGIAHNFEWIAHEWLSEVVFYLIYNKYGEAGIFLFSFGGAVLLIMLIWKQTIKYAEKNFLISSIIYILLSVVVSLFFYGRPHIFSFFFLFHTLKSLYDYYDNPKSKKIFFLPIIAMLWSNFHGGSSNLVYILCIVFLAVGMFSFQVGCLCNEKKDAMWLLKLGMVTILTIGGILVNPAGIKLLCYPYENMTDTLMISIISEWQAPDAKNIGQLFLYFFPIFLLIIGFVLENKKIRLIDAIIMAIFIFLFFRSVRFIVLWYIAASFCAFSYMPECKVKEITTKYEKIICGIVFGVIFAVSGWSVGTMVHTMRHGEIISKVLSDEMVSIVRKNNPSRLFNDYNLGESLIFEEIPVFIDARADMYSANEVLAEGCSLLLLQQLDESAGEQCIDVQSIIEKYQFDALLILKSRPLYMYLLGCSDQYELVASDDMSAYFQVN